VKLFHPYGKSELIDEYSFNAAMEPAILWIPRRCLSPRNKNELPHLFVPFILSFIHENLNYVCFLRGGTLFFFLTNEITAFICWGIWDRSYTTERKCSSLAVNEAFQLKRQAAFWSLEVVAGDSTATGGCSKKQKKPGIWRNCSFTASTPGLFSFVSEFPLLLNQLLKTKSSLANQVPFG
jgi:hypothetical protein